MKKLILITLISNLLFNLAWSHDSWETSRPDAHAPLSVMQDHTHKQGEWMLSYRYRFMDMEGMQKEGTAISTTQVFGEGYMVSPLEMTMKMHMFGLMYAPTDSLTLMLMGNYMEKKMSHATMPGSMMETMLGSTFDRKSSGWGDTKITGLYKIYSAPMHQIHLNAGISLPTGSIDEVDQSLLPYPMQLGSGTYDILPGITYNGQADQLSWGAQLMGKLAIDENSAGYALGDSVTAKAWAGWKLTEWLSLSGQIIYTDTSSIDGSNSRITARMNPTMDPSNSGGEEWDLGLGANILFTQGVFKGHRLALEYITPMDQDLNGVQMETKHSIVIGWQKAF